MIIKDLNKNNQDYLKAHKLEKKFLKAKKLFEQDTYHPSLNLEILEPKHLRIYSFKIDIKYRAIFVVIENEAEIIAITNHYK